MGRSGQDVFDRAGVVIERMDHEFTAEVAGPRLVRLLDTAIGAALLRVNRVAYADGRAHQYLSITLSPNRSRVLISQPGEAFTVAHDVKRLRG